MALAIQYGHLRTAVSGNYASRARGGVHELINIETARAVADTVAELHADLEAGGGVSGPAAKRAIKAAAAAPRFAGTIITATSARRMLANEDAMLYDNPQSLLLCHYKDRAGLPRRGLKSAKTARVASGQPGGRHARPVRFSGGSGVVRRYRAARPASPNRRAGLGGRTGVGQEAEQTLTTTYRFHPLAIRDSANRNQVPKIHRYEDHLFLVLHAPQPGAER